MRIRNLVNSVKSKLAYGKYALATAVVGLPIVSAGTAQSTMISVVGAVVPYVGAIGIPIIAVGAFKLVMAFRNDQGDAVPAAARDIAIGAVLLLFALIWNAIAPALNIA